MLKIFLNYWKPHLVIFLESEIWPSMYREIKFKKIPLILLNARITKKTFKRWNKFKKYSSEIFNLIDYSYPQNNETKNYLRNLGMDERVCNLVENHIYAKRYLVTTDKLYYNCLSSASKS